MNLEGRISRYVSKLEPSVAGQRGHDTLFLAAGKLVSGWALSDEEALPFLFEFNSRCMPPWPASELKRKLKEARKRQDRYKHPIGHLRGGDSAPLPHVNIEKPDVPTQPPDLSRFRKGYGREFEQMAASRHWAVPTLHGMQSAGVLRFGWSAGFPCWVALDASGICAEARRLDDKLFPPFKDEERDLPERKAHTITGSLKSWPVGLQPLVLPRDPLYSIIMTEGTPDFISAYDFVFRHKRNDILPVSMLGRNAGIHGLHPDSVEHLKDRRVRIYVHRDAGDQGLERALHWARQLVALGCKVDLFTFDDVFAPNGKPVKDLTDCVGLNLEELLP